MSYPFDQSRNRPTRRINDPRLLLIRLAMAVIFAPLTFDAAPAAGPARSKRLSVETAVINGEQINVHIYRPKRCSENPGPLLIVFAGYERNAAEYVRRARHVAREHCMTVFVPDLDRNRFPRSRYQRAGVSRKSLIGGSDACMGLFLRGLQVWAREREGRPHARFVLFGHSAGAQLLSRVAAYCPVPDTDRIIIANPSSYVGPSLVERAPFGYADILDIRAREAGLAQYLAQPITVYLGDQDIGDDRLDISKHSVRQGRTRLERGRNVYAAAHAIAVERGWPFGWRLVIAAGIGHSSRDMLRAPEFVDAFHGGTKRAR